jgi:proteasome beta subunit
MDNDEFKKGTTTIGLLCKDGIVLAAETRATMGNMIANKDVDKIFRIQSHLGMTIAGAVADAQKLARYLQVETSLWQIERGTPMKTESAVTLLSNILHSNKYYPYYVQLLMGGYDATGPRLYSLDALGSMIEEKSVSTGSGSPFAYGVIEDKFSENKGIEDNIRVAVHALKAAMERDSFSGNGMNIVTITKDGFQKINPADYLK